jgi:hypothetical protein
LGHRGVVLPGGERPYYPYYQRPRRDRN